MRTRRVDSTVGIYPPPRNSRGPQVGSVLYSPAIQHLGLLKSEATGSSRLRGFALTVWIMRARQDGDSIDSLSELGRDDVGEHLGGASHPARLRRAGITARSFDASNPLEAQLSQCRESVNRLGNRDRRI